MNPNDSNPANSDEMTADAPLIGRIGTPPQLEATADEYHFWANRELMVENTQLVQTQSRFAGFSEPITFYGVVQEVKRVSRKTSMAQEFDTRDGRAETKPELKPEGITYATVSILRARPNVLTPPLEESAVVLGGADCANWAYGFDKMDRPLSIGRLRNGAAHFAGTGKIDLHYLLGQTAGHMNVSGMTGLGAKTTFLLTFLKLLLHEAEKPHREAIYAAPIIFNVKGHDLMWIDKPHAKYKANREDDNGMSDGEKWQELGLSAEPGPFKDAQFFAPRAIAGCNVSRYSWTLRAMLQKGLFRFLFEDTNASDLMFGCVQAIVGFLTEKDGVTLRKEEGRPQTWTDFRSWLRGECEGVSTHLSGHSTGTRWGVLRRLEDILIDGGDIFAAGQEGTPLSIKAAVEQRVADGLPLRPMVIDISALSSALKRFVVAAVVKEVFANANKHLFYLLMLDELNRFAPRDAKDGITKLLEEVALEGRSRGVILLGAQQFASQVSGKIVESAAIRVVGACGAAEMENSIWKGWSPASRKQACGLGQNEKLVTQPTFRGPMLIEVPHPTWAMREGEIGYPPVKAGDELII